MIQVDRLWYKRYKDGEISKEEFADYLLRTFPARDIAIALVGTLDYDFRPIAISQEEFDRHFRIKGIKADGSAEGRGRPRKETTTP